MIVFADFVPGKTMGSLTETPDDEQLAQWKKLYPWDVPQDGNLPDGMATVLMMRAYLDVISPRPPGNIHTRQHMRLFAPILPGEAVTTTITCTSKEMAGERRKLALTAEGHGPEGRAIYSGTLTLYWAA